MINLIIFVLSFSIWLYTIVKNKNPKWYIYILAFIWGFFLCQTILGACGMPTLVDSIMK